MCQNSLQLGCNSNTLKNSFSLRMKTLVLGITCCFSSLISFAQSAPTVGQEFNYPQKETPVGIDNYQFSTYYYSGEKAYNLRNLVMCSVSGDVQSLKVNPSGTSFAALSKKKEKTQVSIYDLWKANKKLHEFANLNQPSAICYTPDARQLLIATPETVHFFDARRYNELDKMAMPFAATAMTISPNGYYLAASDGNSLVVWNLEDKSIRKEFELDTPINDFLFSTNNETFAVLTADGLLSLYGTSNFFIQQSFEAMGNAKDCSFHPDGKYISVVTGDNRIAVLNLMDDQDRNYVENALGGINVARFVRDGKKQVFLTYNTKESLVYRLMDALAPNYTKLLSDELNDRMNEWMKMMPGETLEEYNLRVNDETRAQQMRLYEQEIATRMADNMVQMSEISFGNYNTESHKLAVNFDNMPPIYLDVPSEEVNDFMNPGNLEFRNAKYGLTKNDKFELIYADVYNKVSGKTYVFDNLDRESLDFLSANENFVPLELVQQSNMEEMKLQEIKNNIVDLAQKSNVISGHTDISVNVRIIPSQDANGNKIMNYNVNFAYEVEDGFSAQEDFAPGKYKVENSGAAKSMLSIVKTALETDFAQYVKEGKKLQINITGMADALPIRGKIAYDGCYGDFVNEPVYKNNELSNITVTKADGVTQNEQLAFLRATGVREYIMENVPTLKNMNTNYRHNIEVTSGKGGEFRRITVEFTFVDAFVRP